MFEVIKDGIYRCIGSGVRKRKSPSLADDTNIVGIMNVGDIAGIATGKTVTAEGITWVELQSDPYYPNFPTYVASQFLALKNDSTPNTTTPTTPSTTTPSTTTTTDTTTDAGSYLVDVPSLQDTQDNSMKYIFVGLIVAVVGLMGFALFKK